MKRLLNTLFVTTQGAYLAKEGEAVLVKVDTEVRLRVPLHTLGGIVCFGQVSCSPYLLGACAEAQIAVSMFTEHGQFLARVQGPVSGNVLLRREQYRRADDKASALAIGRSFILGKIANSRAVLQRGARDHAEKTGVDSLQSAAQRLGHVLDSARAAGDVESLRGREAEAAKVYFSVFDHLITAEKDAFFFRERSRRPPLDKLNALLSFVYTLLAHDATAALEGVGIDPQVGFFHASRPGRPALALDLMEEFRPFLADRLVLSLINLRQVDGTGFRHLETGAVLMDDATRKAVLVAYQKRKQEEIQHPFLGESAPVGLLLHLQALLLARHLRRDLDGYPPFLWK